MEFSKHRQRPCAESNEQIDICKEIVKHDITHLHSLPYLQPSGGAFGWEKDTFIDELARPGQRKCLEEDRAPYTCDKIVDHDVSMLHELPQQPHSTHSSIGAMASIDGTVGVTDSIDCTIGATASINGSIGAMASLKSICNARLCV